MKIIRTVHKIGTADRETLENTIAALRGIERPSIDDEARLRQEAAEAIVAAEHACAALGLGRMVLTAAERAARPCPYPEGSLRSELWHELRDGFSRLPPAPIRPTKPLRMAPTTRIRAAAYVPASPSSFGRLRPNSVRAWVFGEVRHLFTEKHEPVTREEIEKRVRDLVPPESLDDRKLSNALSKLVVSGWLKPIPRERGE